jgi:ribosomal 50S subunit-recycling heat shock protein
MTSKSTPKQGKVAVTGKNIRQSDEEITPKPRKVLHLFKPYHTYKVAQEKKHKKIDREEQVHTNTHYTV